MIMRKEGKNYRAIAEMRAFVMQPLLPCMGNSLTHSQDAPTWKRIGINTFLLILRPSQSSLLPLRIFGHRSEHPRHDIQFLRREVTSRASYQPGTLWLRIRLYARQSRIKEHARSACHGKQCRST